ncbi:hypothetical protein [Paraeggerthella hongkongensis]|uniref:hypothetical protein n=1 Tax=Paraeggerthella hongkongensis TaxID=230658 RepID=UPI001B86BB12|nr:hypothetical protein [Paraeggerthella hongkongensis]
MADGARADGCRRIYHVGDPVEFEGYVDDFAEGVSALEFSLDNGETWTAYATTGAVAERGVNWRFVYTPERPGCYLLKARARDARGRSSSLVSGFAFEVLP